MKSRRGFAIQRLMNAMRQAHADGWFIVFDTLTLAFFFQTEYCIRDGRVTGVQTCALPIYYIDFIPEIPSLTHAYYLLTRHRELAEVPDAEWPDAYCPSAAGSYKLLFDVMDEMIEVTRSEERSVGIEVW